MKDLSLCRRLKISWLELQGMPEDLVGIWDAVLSGEEHAQMAQAAAANAGGG